MKRIIIFFLLCIIVLGVFSSGTSAIKQFHKYMDTHCLIYEYIKHVNNGDYDKIAYLFPEKDHKEFELFFANPSNRLECNGIFTVKKISLLRAEKMQTTDIDKITYLCSIFPNDYNLFSNVEYWLVNWDLDVYQNTRYFTRGNSYALFIIGSDGSKTQILDMIMLPEYEIVISNNNEISIMSYDSPVGSEGSQPWSNPSHINVYRTQEGVVERIPFKDYCKIVATCEVGFSSWDEDALKACALAIKNYGWRRMLKPKKYTVGYDVRDDELDQVYDPDKTLIPACTKAVNSIWNYVMLDCNYKLFAGFHVKNSNYNQYARYHGGVLSQEGSRDLAYTGKSWSYILHYYFDYGEYVSDMGDGKIIILNINHTPVETGPYYYNAGLHWRLCTVCTCYHRKPHNWVNYSTYYQCADCGYITTNPIFPNALLHDKFTTD